MRNIFYSKVFYENFKVIRTLIIN